MVRQIVNWNKVDYAKCLYDSGTNQRCPSKLQSKPELIMGRHEFIFTLRQSHHLSQNNLYEQFQSGFLPLHCTETALIKITDNLLMAADSGLAILILLDLSAAFDTLCHTTPAQQTPPPPPPL